MAGMTTRELLEKLYNQDYEKLKGKKLRMTRVRVPGKEVKRNKQWKAISGGKSLIHGIIISFNAQMYNYY